MKRSIPILAISVLLVLSPMVFAGSYSIPPLPDFPNNAWTPGSALTYHLSYAQGADEIGLDVRVALLSTEVEPNTGEKLYWTEIDITNASGMPQDVTDFFVQNYGEPPKAILMNMLIPKYDFSLLFTDPSKAYKDFTTVGFIRKLYWQYNKQTPYDVDPQIITGFMLPLIVSDLMNGDVPEDFIENNNLGITFVEDKEKFTSETSESETAVKAGNFKGTNWTFSSSEPNGFSGSVFISPVLPILPFVTYQSVWANETGSGQIATELLSISPSGAASLIVGEPIPFDWQTMMMGTPSSGN